MIQNAKLMWVVTVSYLQGVADMEKNCLCATRTKNVLKTTKRMIHVCVFGLTGFYHLFKDN